MTAFLRRLALFLFLCATAAVAQQQPQTGRTFIDAARGPTPITESTKPPLLGNSVNDDVRRTRNYAMQPPVIPHRVDGYQIDKNFNKCMDCHARSKVEVSQAVPVSITHYMDRDGRVLGQISTRRYFCMQCHVAQEPVNPIVPNTFQDIDTVIQRSSGTKAK
ncbi:nitrate reductase cytochrome c-type subunit [Xylophilus sp.]|uniref:nitrate reductase cytochrome c-type subunit n=1 Tax=Xylophilus sp. TaxID=2653893 RepID=UPI0013BA8941|nr:nitrate reductase cytochrome c-type subunit [Xylophilus sp.]KAF1050157.1 MAG: Periplasmic nitrate reductase, electron transfer subunit [Xylophilus sp.]